MERKRFDAYEKGGTAMIRPLHDIMQRAFFFAKALRRDPEEKGSRREACLPSAEFFFGERAKARDRKSEAFEVVTSQEKAKGKPATEKAELLR